MSGDVAMTLLKTPVFFDELQVVSSNNYSALHLGAQHQALDDSPPNGDVTRKRAFFIHVRALQFVIHSPNKQGKLGSHGFLEETS